MGQERWTAEKARYAQQAKQLLNLKPSTELQVMMMEGKMIASPVSPILISRGDVVHCAEDKNYQYLVQATQYINNPFVGKKDPGVSDAIQAVVANGMKLSRKFEGRLTILLPPSLGISNQFYEQIEPKVKSVRGVDIFCNPWSPPLNLGELAGSGNFRSVYPTITKHGSSSIEIVSMPTVELPSRQEVKRYVSAT